MASQSTNESDALRSPEINDLLLAWDEMKKTMKDIKQCTTELMEQYNRDIKEKNQEIDRLKKLNAVLIYSRMVED